LPATHTSSVHGLPSLAHTFAAPAAQVPYKQLSPIVHTLPSSHAAVAGS